MLVIFVVIMHGFMNIKLLYIFSFDAILLRTVLTYVWKNRKARKCFHKKTVARFRRWCENNVSNVEHIIRFCERVTTRKYAAGCPLLWNVVRAVTLQEALGPSQNKSVFPRFYHFDFEFLEIILSRILFYLLTCWIHLCLWHTAVVPASVLELVAGLVYISYSDCLYACWWRRITGPYRVYVIFVTEVKETKVSVSKPR